MPTAEAASGARAVLPHVFASGARAARTAASASGTPGPRAVHVAEPAPVPPDASASARAPGAAPGSRTERPAPALLRQALADARSPRVPDLSPYVPERPFPWNGPGLPLSGTGSGAAIDLDRVLRLSLAAPTGTPGRLRPVPSAGALHPVRAHLLLGPGCSLSPGRYAYDPRTHRAHPRGPAPADVPPGALVVLTVAASRTVAHYGHRAWPLLLLDAGHAAAALALAGPPAVGVRVALDADGALLSAAAGLPPAPDWQDVWPGTEPELPLAAAKLYPLGRAGGADGSLSAWAALPRAGAPEPQPGAETSPPRELAAARHLLHHIAEATALPGGTWYPAPRPGAVTDDVLEARRSAPPDGLNHLPGHDALARIVATARTVRPAGPAWTAAVGGATPALYDVSASGSRGLAVRATGDARPTLARWAAHQQWVGTAGAVLLAHGCPEDAPPAAFRSSRLIAGYAVGTAQAHAAALGLRSRPIGSWQQADLGAALGDTPGRDWIVHGLALGGPRPPRAHRSPSAPPP
ncbi:nitroreductase [Streptomyces sp. NPDC091289]|uniref:nitroreductase n=1 Tax=Streptomyces sp. NPDC091289 TaxID=3365989 RepID=UPI00380E8707